MSKHTPGKWVTDHNNHVGGRRSICVSISEFGPGGLICDEVLTEEDANLIVAAPKLLEVCQDLVGWFEDNHPVHEDTPLRDKVIVSQLKSAIKGLD